MVKAFEVPIVQPTDGGLKLGVVENRRYHRYSKVVRESRGTINRYVIYGKGTNLIPRPEGG